MKPTVEVAVTLQHPVAVHVQQNLLEQKLAAISAVDVQ